MPSNTTSMLLPLMVFEYQGFDLNNFIITINNSFSVGKSGLKNHYRS